MGRGLAVGEERRKQDTKSRAKLLPFTAELAELGERELPGAGGKSKRRSSNGFYPR